MECFVIVEDSTAIALTFLIIAKGEFVNVAAAKCIALARDAIVADAAANALAVFFNALL